MKTMEYYTSPRVSLGHATSREDSKSSSAYLIFPELTPMQDDQSHQNCAWYALLAESAADTEQQAMAAQLSVESIYRYMVDNVVGKPQVRYALEAALCHANSTLLRVSKQEKISSTFCASALSACIDRDRFYITYVGDIHAYLLRSGLIYHLAHAITINSHAPLAQRRNEPEDQSKYYLGKTAIPLVKHISFNVANTFTSHMFPPSRKIMNYLQLRPDDVIVLCSSGISNTLDPRELGAIATTTDSQTAAAQITQRAEEETPTGQHTAIVIRQNQLEPVKINDYAIPTRHRNLAAMAY